MKITLAKGGTAEKTVELKDIHIPDLYNIARLPELQEYAIGDKSAKEAILECWHLAHDLLKKLREIESRES